MPAAEDKTVSLQRASSSEPRQPRPSAWAAIWKSVARFQADKVIPWVALRNTLGVALPLAAGVLLGAVSSGLVVGTGALNVSFSDSQEPYVRRARRMIAASFLVGLAVFAGSLTGRNNITAVAVVAGWAFAAGIFVALGPAAADLGTISLVTLAVYGALPLPPEKAMAAGLLALAGGVFQTLLAVAFWPLRRYVPERRALGELYAELSRVAASPIHATEAPPASAQSTQAQNSLAALDQDHSVEGERYRVLLSQAERMRLSLVTLARLRTRMQRESPASPEVGILGRYFEICSGMLGSIGNLLLAGERAIVAPENLRELQSLAEELRGPDPAKSPTVTATAPQLLALKKDARFQMDALAGQLRSAVDLAAYATPAGHAAFERREARNPWRLRLGGTLATLRANLSLESAACRHAVRLAASVAIGDALARGIELRRSYWLPMTIAIVLKPDFTATFSRGVLRLIGTFAGLVIATGLFHVLPPTLFAEVALIAVFMFVLRCLGPANYGILVTAVTALVVLLISMTGVAPKEVMAARALNTAAGGVIALLAYWLWPTWERTQIPETMAQMLDAYRGYFHAIREAYTKPEITFSSELDRTRGAARLARSNVEASIDRLTAEPGTSADSVRLPGGILASSHRLVHAMMALDSGLSSSHPVPAREAFQPFANDVERTLYYLAAALRGSPLSAGALPDLREDHHALVHSGDSLTERYALVNVETDRITNSLNTLTEELRRWIDFERGPKGQL
jgi:uncharacterized membrane protein YccC